MTLSKRLAAGVAVAGVLSVVGPVAGASAATLPAIQPPSNPSANVCLHGVVDPGPLGPHGPYGPDGPYGPSGPLHNQQNPLGNVATCGGAITYLLRGGNPVSFVQSNLNSVPH